MPKYIIPIERASEELINRLIKDDVLYVDEIGIHVTEKSCRRPKQDRTNQKYYTVIIPRRKKDYNEQNY